MVNKTRSCFDIAECTTGRTWFVSLVEPMGFEPTTSSMPSRRSPNCATAPPLQNLRSSRFHRDALPTAPRPHRGATSPYYHRKIAHVYQLAAGISASLPSGTNLKIVQVRRREDEQGKRSARA